MHEHHHDTADYSRAFKIGVALNVGFIIVEVVFGLLADSLVLLADAGHNLSDVFGLLLAWGASHLTQRESTDRHTYGWRKSSILAALFNAIILLVAIGGIGWEAIRRLNNPSHSFNLALDAVPKHIDPKEVKNFLSNLPGVSQVHDLHIWGMSTTEVALTAHVVKQNAIDADSLLAEIKKELHDQFGIGHTTIQWERGDELHSKNSYETSR
jgi:Co/Zn/Cd efflux system component